MVTSKSNFLLFTFQFKGLKKNILNNFENNLKITLQIKKLPLPSHSKLKNGFLKVLFICHNESE